MAIMRDVNGKREHVNVGIGVMRKLKNLYDY